MRRAEIHDAGQIDGQIDENIDGQNDGQIDGQVDGKTDRRIDRRIGRATTSLTPYGMSFWALILAACGDGRSTTAGAPKTAGAPAEKLQREGYVYDGPVKGADVYVDVDGDGQLNPEIDEYVGTTNASGAFSGSISAGNRDKRYIVDLTKAKDLGNDKIEGTDDDQDLSEFGTWRAPADSSVVSPFTHGLVTGEIKREDLPAEFDPLKDNPYQPDQDSEDNREAREELFAAVRKALPLVAQNLSRTTPTNPEGEQNPAPTASDPLKAALETLQQAAEDIEYNPVLAKSGSFALDLTETASSDAGDTGLRFSVTDQDGNFTGPPTVDDNRFELKRDGANWQLFVKAGHEFSANETITLNITATDTTGRRDIETVSITVAPAPQPAPAPAPPPPNAKPTGVSLSRPTHNVDEGSTVSGALARITIADDGEGTVGLQTLPQNSIFEYRAVIGERGVYDLYLKSGVTLDQSKVGDHRVTIQATGDGTGQNPDPVTFTLKVRNVNDPTTGTPRITGTPSEGETLTADTSALRDADGIGSFAYQWKADGQDISGATGATYRLTNAEVGKAITVEVTHTDGRGTVEPAITSRPTVQVSNVNEPPQPQPGPIEIVFTTHATLTASPPNGFGSVTDTGIRFTVSGAGENPDIRITTPNGSTIYSYAPDGDGFKILARSGHKFVNLQTYHLIVQVRVDGRQTVERDLKFVVGDPLDGSKDLGSQNLQGNTDTIDIFKVDDMASNKEGADKIIGFEVGRDRIQIGEPPAGSSSFIDSQPSQSLDIWVRVEGRDTLIYNTLADAQAGGGRQGVYAVLKDVQLTAENLNPGGNYAFAGSRPINPTFVPSTSESIDQEHDAPQPNAKPTGVSLSRPTHNVDEGSTVSGALAQITIADDGEGTVGLQPLPQNSIFEYRAVIGERGVYDLYLKSGVTLDQSKVGDHRVAIQATGDGTGDDPDTVTFTLTVRNAVNDLTEGTVSVNGLTANSVQVGSTVTAEIDLTDPDDSSLDFSRVWQKKQTDGTWHDIDTDNDDSFTPGVAGVYQLKVTATDSTHGSSSPHFSREFTVNDPPNDPQQPEPASGLTLSLSDPQAQQVVINETTGDSRTTERIFTGFDLSVSKSNMNLPDFFQDAKKLAGGAAGPKVLIERKSDDGTYAVDSRFGYNKQGLLAINPGASLDYEAERGADGRPDGLIELRITITDADGDTTELLVNIQLTNVNEAPEGIIALMVGVDDSGTPDDDRTPYDPTGPRLPTGTIFSINKKSLRDPDDPERDNLTYTYRWVLLGTQSEDDVFTDETFTPRKVGGVPYPGREDGHNRRVDVTASDGVNSVTKSLYFHVYKKTQIDRSEHAINENETATSPLATIDFDVPGGGRISGVYKIISVNGIDMTPSWAQSPFEIRNYGELWLKSDYRLDHEANSSYEIVLRHYPISGSPYADVTFTLNVNDVNEAPIVQMRGAYAFDFTRDSRDVLQRIAIYDPDNSQDLDQSELTTLTLELTDTRFTLEEYTPDFINTFVPLGLVGKHYNLKINDDASFNTNGETVKLTITAYEGENRDTGKSGTLTLTIHIQPATSGQSSGQGGGVAMTEVVNVDFLPDAGGEDLGMVQNDFLWSGISAPGP